MRVLMVGATGRRAGMVLPELTRRGVAVRALVRDSARARIALDHGATEVAIGDLRDPASLDRAVNGVDGVFHINPAFAVGEADLGVAMVNAATAAGVSKFVFSSVIHPSASAMRNHTEKLPVENALSNSGMDYTVLQPAMFMQTLGDFWPGVVEHDRFAAPFSMSAEFCFVDYRDVAEAAAIAMTTDRLSRGTFELCAEGMVTGRTIASTISAMVGRRITAMKIPLDTFLARLPEGPARSQSAQMMIHYDQHGLAGGNALVLRAILGREPRALAEYLSELADTQTDDQFGGSRGTGP
ncbi:SDR family oxidoreductase [Pseudonocardia spinosispora]|uniref:SDR family oxidoreductase n=1 Tax=Pseudonocardia spinosispora TaxID=103441 RepID=UPI0004035245|nr:NmrA family NAD(P)-binding protein [Pseudonocardia spinosispora]